MTVLLATDDLELYPAGAADEHGWVDTGAAAIWAGRGSLQIVAADTGPGADDGGGHGPFDPASTPNGLVYLPADAPARDGSALEARGERWVLSQVRYVADPAGLGLDCLVAAVNRWPAP